VDGGEPKARRMHGGAKSEGTNGENEDTLIKGGAEGDSNNVERRMTSERKVALNRGRQNVQRRGINNGRQATRCPSVIAGIRSREWPNGFGRARNPGSKDTTVKWYAEKTKCRGGKNMKVNGG